MDLSTDREGDGLRPVALLLQEQRNLLEMIATGVPLDACLEALCLALSRLSPGIRANILMVDEAGGSFPRGIAPDHPLAYLEAVKDAPIGQPAVGTCAEAVYRGEQIICSDIAKEEKWSQAWKDLCAVHGVRACVSDSILALDGRPLGSLMLSFSEAREPTEWEQRMLKFGTYVASIALTRDRTSRALRRSEERYATLFESIDVGFCVMEMISEKPIDFRLLEANPMFVKISGLSEAVGKTLRELGSELEEEGYEILARLATSGESVREERGLGERWFQVYAYRVDRPDERRIAVLFEDITRRKRHEAGLAYLASLSQDLAGPGDLDEMMRAAAASICQFMKLSACAFVETEEEADRLVVAYDWHRAEVPGTVGVYALEESISEEFLEASRRGEVFRIRDAADEARAVSDPSDALKIRAFLSAPVLRDGRWRFALCVYDTVARDWQPDEIELVGRVANRVWTRLERAHGEEALKESERKLRQIFEGAMDYAIFAVDGAGHFTSWSPGAERLFGYEEKEVLHRHMELIFTPPDRADQTAHRELERAKVNGVAENERWHQRKDGSQFFASGLTQPIIDRGHHVGFTTICRDRTPQRQAREWLERELRDSQRLQAASARLVAESDLSTLLEESLRAAVSITHAEMGTIHLVEGEHGEEGEALRLLVSKGFAPGAPGDFLLLLPQNETSCSAAIREGKRVVVADLAQYQARNPALERLATAGVRAAQWTPLFSRPGRLLGVIATYWSHPHQPAQRELRLLDQLARQVGDLVERHQSEAKLRELSTTLERRVQQRTAELQEQTARLQSLAAKLTTAEQRERKRIAALLHDDLQQLLVAASMQLGLVVGRTDAIGGKAVAQATEWLNEARAAARDLTRQLRPPALYEDGLVAALHWLASEMKKRHRLEVHIDGNEPVCRLNDDFKALLFESVRELLFNVTKYAGVHSAEVVLREEADALEIVVSDAGIGFDVEAVGTSRQSQGSGLFSIRERLFALGGKMKMISSPGNGTRIELCAPLTSGVAAEQARLPAAGQDASAAEDPDGSPAPADESRIEVMVVDDHPMVREGIANIISRDRRLHVSGQACDGIEAIQVVERHPPDVVLMDVNMPRMNGIEATREIHRRWPETRIIGLSVQDDATTAKSMCDAGAGAFISKSGNSDSMIAAILDQVPLKSAVAAPAVAGVF